MTHTTPVSPRADTRDLEIPYPKSWIDSLTLWISRIPGPSWLFYVILYLLFGVLNNSVRWMDGSLAAGTFLRVRVLDAGYLVFFLAFYEYLRGAADRSFQIFRRILQAPDGELAQYEYEVTTLPRSLGRLAILAGLGLSLASLRANPESFGLDLLSKLLPILYLYLTVIFSFSCLFALLIQTVRQLRLVNYLHLRANEINLFQLGPAHAFSRLTARTGIGLIAFILYSALAESGDITKLNLVALVLIGILAIVVFAVPLLGMRGRLEAEKNRMLEELNERIQLTLTRIHRQVDSNEHDNIGQLKTAMNALIEERGIIRGISTWPWGGNTFRGFASTILLPIFLWLVTRLLERVF
jgi:hypothetical protein